MINVVISLGVLATGWYTFNIARIAWAEGKKGGAVRATLLALTAVGLPLWMLFFGHSP